MAIATFNITASAANVYVSSGNTAITFMSLTNYDSTDVSVDVWVVPGGDAAGNTNIALSSLTITAGDTYQFYAGAEKLLLENGDAIVAEANSASRLNAVVSYTSI